MGGKAACETLIKQTAISQTKSSMQKRCVLHAKESSRDSSRLGRMTFIRLSIQLPLQNAAVFLGGRFCDLCTGFTNVEARFMLPDFRFLHTKIVSSSLIFGSNRSQAMWRASKPHAFYCGRRWASNGHKSHITPWTGFNLNLLLLCIQPDRNT